MKVKPLASKILVKPDDPEEVTEGGIVLADISVKRDPRGVVVAVGDEVRLVAEGDHIIFGKYAGYEIDEDYVIVQEDDVHAVLSED